MISFNRISRGLCGNLYKTLGFYFGNCFWKRSEPESIDSGPPVNCFVFAAGVLLTRTVGRNYAFEKRDDNFIPFGFHVFAALAVAKYC